MSKSRRNFFEEEDRFEYEAEDHRNRQNSKLKRRNKRIDRALKTKDIDMLNDLDEEEF